MVIQNDCMNSAAASNQWDHSLLTVSVFKLNKSLGGTTIILKLKALLVFQLGEGPEQLPQNLDLSLEISKFCQRDGNESLNTKTVPHLFFLTVVVETCTAKLTHWCSVGLNNCEGLTISLNLPVKLIPAASICDLILLVRTQIPQVRVGT